MRWGGGIERGESPGKTCGTRRQIEWVSSSVPHMVPFLLPQTHKPKPLSGRGCCLTPLFASFQLQEILVSCNTNLTQGRFTWQQDQVLRCLAAELENKRTINTMLLGHPSSKRERKEKVNSCPESVHWMQSRTRKCSLTLSRNSLFLWKLSALAWDQI